MLMDFILNAAGQIDAAKVLFLLGQVFSLCSAASLIISSLRAKKEKIMFWQLMESFFTTLTDLCLGAYSAGITNFLAATRNTLLIKKKYSKFAMIACTLVSVVLGMLVNTIGWVGGLAIVAGLIANIGLYYAKSDQNIRSVLFLVLIFWSVHDFIVGAYPIALVELLSTIGLFVNFVRVSKKNKKSKKHKKGRRITL